MRFIDRRTFVKLAGASGAMRAMQAAGIVDEPRARQGDRAAALPTLPERTIRDFASGFHGNVVRPSDTAETSASAALPSAAAKDR